MSLPTGYGTRFTRLSGKLGKSCHLSSEAERNGTAGNTNYFLFVIMLSKRRNGMSSELVKCRLERADEALEEAKLLAEK